MRAFLAVLLLLTAAGLGLGALILFTQALGSAKSFADAAYASAMPFLIGTVALVGVTVTLAIDESRKDVVAKLDKR